MKIARVGILLDQKASEQRWKYGLNVFEHYMVDMADFTGFPYRIIHSYEDVNYENYDIVIAACAPENETAALRLMEYAKQGGVVFAYANINSVADKLGYVQGEAMDSGYAVTEPEQGQPYRFLRAVPWVVNPAAEQSFPVEEAGDVRKSPAGGDTVAALLQKFKVGSGAVHRWSVDIAGTIVQLQQGKGPVLDDGVPAPDGSGSVNDGLLKADDRIALDWEADRLKTETGQPYFAYPYADLWREAFVRHLLEAVTERGLTLPFIDYWPEGVSQVAMISHDSDGNKDEFAEATIELLAESNVQSSWCMLEPGYSPEIYERLKQAGHEIAFHYNALAKHNGVWDEAEFNRQLHWLKAAAGIDEVVSNKNHYTRYEGWGELFEWMERSGIASDQTRGSSKRGNVGFLFGTCHPYFPIAWWKERNRIYNVLEIGFLTQDLDLAVWADSSVITPFLQQVKRVRGVAHFLFHQIHIYKQEAVRNAFRKVVQSAREIGFAFWTAKKINNWVRERRAARIMGIDGQGCVQLEHLPQSGSVVVWIPIPNGAAIGDAEQVEVRFGVRCRKQTAG